MDHASVAVSGPVHRGVSEDRPLRGFQAADAVLALGGAVALPGLAWHDDPGLPCSAVLLVGPVSAGELAAAADAMPDPGAPVADFAANHGVRHDVAAPVLDAQTLAAARMRMAPIAQRLLDLPFRAAREERAEMAILRLAYSRASAIEARWPSLVTRTRSISSFERYD